MAKRAGLKRGLDDIPSQRANASRVITSFGSERRKHPRSAPAGAGVTLRVVRPDEAPPAPASRRAAGPKKPAPAPRRAPEPGEAARARRKAPRTRARAAAAAAPPPAPGAAPRVAAPEATRGEGAGSPRSPRAATARAAELARTFYERLGRDVARVFQDTVRRVMAAGLGADSVVPSLLGRVVRAYGEMPTRLQEGIGSVLKSGNDLWDPATWEGLSYLMRSSLEMKVEAMRRRRQGLYEVDEFGLDDEYLENVRPLMRFLYHKWFRVTVTGLEHVPATGRTLFVANHSGVLPYDGAMIAAAIWEEHPSPRLVRALHLEWFVGVPFVAPFLQKTGQVMAIPENGERLLERDHLVTVFPEGLKGVGKLFKDRYQLARFGRGGFIRMALRARAPIIPVSVVGAEEIHPVLFQADFISRPLGLPYLPVTPTFPILGPLGLVPLPSKWYIHFGAPIDLSAHDPEEANDFNLVSQLSDQVRGEVQNTIHELLKRRRSVFQG